MNILYILRHNPWGIGGGCYACRCYLDAFTEVFKGAHLDVCICEEYINDNGNSNGNENCHYNGVQPRGTWAKVLSPVTGMLHRFDETARRMLKSKQYDYCIFDHNSIAGPLVGLCKKLGVRTIVINHNCEAEYYRDNHDWLHRALFLRHVKSAEKKSYLGCDYNIFLTEEDRALFEKLYGKSKTRSIVTGCFEFKKNTDVDETVNEMSPKDEHLKLVISGTIGNVQNMNGIQYFLYELLEFVPKGAEVVIAGKNPPDSLQSEITRLNQSSKYAQLTLIPNPTDINSIVNGCDIFLCPTRLGGGLKLRVMDGLRAGLPVIAHKMSARGYSEFAKQGCLWSFENKHEFATALSEAVQLIKSNELNRWNIQDFAKKQFSFRGKVEMLKSAIA